MYTITSHNCIYSENYKVFAKSYFNPWDCARRRIQPIHMNYDTDENYNSFLMLYTLHSSLDPIL